MSTKRRDRVGEIARAASGPLSVSGMKNARLSDIGASLGMTGAHLLYYFESKADLFMVSLRTVESDLRAHAHEKFETMPSARARWEWLIDSGAPAGLHDSGLLMWLEAWSEAVHQVEMRELVTELEDDWQGLLRETLLYGVSRGELEPVEDLDGLIEGVSALLDGLTIRVVVGHRPVDHGAAIKIVHRFVGPWLTWRDTEADS